jgi:hypothetical protein
MNQTIGIQFTASGMESVTAAVAEIKKSLKSLDVALDRAGGGKSGLAGTMAQAATSAEQFAGAISKAAGATGGINALAMAMERVAIAAGRLSGLKMPQLPVGQTGSQAPLLPPGRATQGGYTYPIPGVVPGRSAQSFQFQKPNPQWAYSQNRTQPTLLPQATEIPLSKGTDGKWGYIPPTTDKGGGKRPPKPPKSGGLSGRPGRYEGMGFFEDSITAGGTILRYGLPAATMYGGYRFGKNYFQNILGGKAREGVMEASKGLVATDFDTQERAVVEAAGSQFTSKFPLYGQKGLETYLTATAESASSFDPNRVGYKNIKGLTETSMKLSAMTGQKDPQQSVRLITDILNAKMLRLTPKRRESALSPSSDYLSKESEKIAGQLNAAIRVFPAWGKDIQNFQAQGLGVFLEKGWDLPEILSYFGVLKSAGFKSSTIGRGAKSLLSKETRTMARLDLLNRRDAQGKLAIDPSKLGKYKKDEIQLQQKYAKMMRDNPDEGLEQFFRQYTLAKQNYADPLELAGSSRDFRSMISTELEPGVRAAQRENAEIIRKEGEGGTTKLDAQLTGNMSSMVSGWSRLTQEMEKANIALAAVNTGFSGFSKLAEKLSGYTQQLNAIKLQEGRPEPTPGQPVIPNDPNYNEQRKKYLRGLVDAGLPREMIDREVISTDPKIINRERNRPGASFDSPASGLFSGIYNAIANHKPWSEGYTLTPLVDSLAEGSPMISPKPQMPTPQEQMDARLRDAIGEEPPKPKPEAGGDAGSLINDGAHTFSTAVGQFAGAVGGLSRLGAPNPSVFTGAQPMTRQGSK